MEEIKAPKQFVGKFPIKTIGDSYYILLGKNVRDSIEIDGKSEILVSIEKSDSTYKCPGCGYCVKNLNETGGVKNDGRKSE